LPAPSVYLPVLWCLGGAEPDHAVAAGAAEPARRHL